MVWSLSFLRMTLVHLLKPKSLKQERVKQSSASFWYLPCMWAPAPPWHFPALLSLACVILGEWNKVKDDWSTLKSGLFLAREDPLLQEQWNVHFRPSPVIVMGDFGLQPRNNSCLGWCLPSRGKAKSQSAAFLWDTSTAIYALWCSDA